MAPEVEALVVGGAVVGAMRRMVPQLLLAQPFVGTNWHVADDVLVFCTALLALQAEFFGVDEH